MGEHRTRLLCLMPCTELAREPPMKNGTPSVRSPRFRIDQRPAGAGSIPVRRRSVVSSNSNPASSAAFNSAPLLSVSQPLDCAVWTVCAEDRARASPFGVP